MDRSICWKVSDQHQIFQLSIEPCAQLFTYKCRLRILFANSLDPDQAPLIIGPDLDTNYLALCWYSCKNFSKKLILKKSAVEQKSMHIKFRSTLLLSADFLQEKNISEITLDSYRLDPDQDLSFVCSDPGINCLQWLRQTSGHKQAKS